MTLMVLDLFVGYDESGTFYFENTGSVTVPMFEARGFELTNSASVETPHPSADLDDDGDIDYLIGESSRY